MEDNQITFNGQPFLEKEAAPSPRAILHGAKNVWQNLRRSTPPVPGGSPTPPVGKFVLRPGDSVVDPAKLNVFNRQEVVDKAADEIKREGTGSFVTDAVLGLTKKVFPGAKEPIENAVVKAKGTFEHLDTQAGKVMAGEKPNSFRGKLFSSKINRHVADETNADGSISKIMKEDRRPSVVAPVENGVKFATPFLATAYVADKLYPQNKELSKNVNVPTYETDLNKQSAELESEEIFDKSLVEDMDKIASLQKIAKLEDDLEKTASELYETQMEKVAVEKRLEETTKERLFFEKQASLAKNNLLEKEAEFDELRLRTIAQKRSKVAVDLSEEMLECGLIKQAELKGTIDDLMEADERTVRVYQNLVKEAKTEEESLESLSILREYKGNDKLATTSMDLAPQGLSKRGQSIGEAARDLNK